MLIQEVLARRDHQLITIRPEDTIETAASILSSNNIGACPVRDEGGKLAGVLSERDIMRALAAQGGKVTALRVRDLMTTEVATCRLSDEVKAANDTMARRHIRHLPILDGAGELVGMFSMRDIIECLLEQKEMEVNVLRDISIARAS